MNKTNLPEPDLDNLLRRTLEDNVPSQAEERMNRQFLRLKRTLDRPEILDETDEWLWQGLFRKEVLVIASAVMLILGAVMQFGGSQSALAHSIEQLKVTATMSMHLNRAAFMDCTVLKAGAGGEDTSYRVLWRANGDTRVDITSAGNVQTIWVSHEAVSFAGSGGGSIRSVPLGTLVPGPVWQPAMEFRTPALLAKQMEEQYGLAQIRGRRDAGSGEFLIVGRAGSQSIEITVDSRTYLPKVIKKYAPDSDHTNGERDCIMEARFLWNQPIAPELFVPGLPGEGNKSNSSRLQP